MQGPGIAEELGGSCVVAATHAAFFVRDRGASEYHRAPAAANAGDAGHAGQMYIAGDAGRAGHMDMPGICPCPGRVTPGICTFLIATSLTRPGKLMALKHWTLSRAIGGSASRCNDSETAGFDGVVELLLYNKGK